MSADKDRQVVGVVEDVRHLALEQAAGNEMYLPMRQSQDRQSMILVVRSKEDNTQLAASVRAELLPVDPGLPNVQFKTLRGIVDDAVSPRRFIVMLLSGFAGFALILASLGIYAVISYSVGQRTAEICIRMALGASPQAVRVEETSDPRWHAVGVALNDESSVILLVVHVYRNLKNNNEEEIVRIISASAAN